MTSVTANGPIVNGKLTAQWCAGISTPLIEKLQIKKPRFHIWHSTGLHASANRDLFGETAIINSKPHVFISDKNNNTWSELLSTIAHELVHCWQFTFQQHCNGEQFSEAECEIQAYALEPLTTVTLAAAALSKEMSDDR